LEILAAPVPRPPRPFDAAAPRRAAAVILAIRHSNVNVCAAAREKHSPLPPIFARAKTFFRFDGENNT